MSFRSYTTALLLLFSKDIQLIKKDISTIIIKNVSWAANQYIRMISEGWCDTEDWSNDYENSALITEINYTLLYIHIENSYSKFQ